MESDLVARPDFPTIAERFAALLSEDRDPRPVARIKNKKVSRISIAAGGAAPEREGGAIWISGSKGANLMNTEWAIAICIYTGIETKIMLNSQAGRVKMSHLEKMLNTLVIIICCV